MKTYIIKYTHCGEPREYKTTSLYEFSNKLEYLMMDRQVLDESITINTIEDEK